MLPSHQPLLDAVLANLDDDRRRLVYADALSEADDPRGEFITVQCRLAARKGTAAQLSALRAREKELLAAHREEWLGPLERFLRKNDAYGLKALEVRRGFVTAARVQVSDAEVLPTLLRLAPALERLTLRGGEAAFLPELSRLSQLDAEGDCAASVVEWVTSRPFPRLTHLTLDAGYGFRTLRPLTLAHQPALRVLEVGSRSRLGPVTFPPLLERLTWPGFEHSAALATTTQLRTLRLGFTELEAPLLEAVLGLREQLETLALDTRNLNALETLLSARWPKLAHLDLSGTSLGPLGAAMLARLKAPDLVDLDLTNTRLTGSGAWTVLRSPLLPSLRQLSLRSNRLTDADLAALPKLEHQLGLLNLKKNKLSPRFLEALEEEWPQTRLSR